MKILPVFVLCVFLALVDPISAEAQLNPRNPYRTDSGRTRTPQEAEAVKRAQQIQTQQEARLREWQRASTSNGGSQPEAAALRKARQVFLKTLVKPTQIELSTLKQELDHSNGGVFTFLSNDSCLQRIDDLKQAAFARVPCIDQLLPGRGSQFSFRRKNYSSANYADVGMMGEWLFAFGYITQTILVDLEETPLSEVNLRRADLRYMIDFVPATSMQEANKQRVELENGVSFGDRKFFNAVKAVKGHTYVVRSIAYRGNLKTEIKGGGKTFKIDHLEGDQRKDVIVAFRLLATDNNGNTRVLWRNLRMVDAPWLEL